MALANFFDKAALGASQILQGYNREDFEARLSDSPIELAFDINAANTAEGIATLDLTARLLSRLYPKIIFTALEDGANAHREILKTLALSINPVVELQEEKPFASIVVGNTLVQRDRNVFYIGSNQWTVKFSISHPVFNGNSHNPFGAGVAACFGAANVFRAVFKDQLLKGESDSDFELSLVDFKRVILEEKNDLSTMDNSIPLGEAFLVGLGAIGNGALWALSKLKGLEGCLHVIDHETIEISNLQRYVLATQDDTKIDKVALCDKWNNNGVFEPYKGNWASFLADRQDWNLNLVAMAVDSAEDRISIQASLPRQILNAWTQESDLGISRHFDFINEACTACLYPTKEGLQPRSVLIAGALGLSSREVEIREMLYNNTPLDEIWLKQIAEARQIDFETLVPYVGLSISDFYSNVLCGGLVTTNANNQNMETPMAFQSAMAGILLASELIIHVTHTRKTSIETMTRINLLQPLTIYLNDPLKKTANKHCICNDADFQTQYKEKYFDAGELTRSVFPST